LFTFGLIVVGFLQWNILEKTDETIRLRDRAFISVDGLEIRPQKDGIGNILRWRIDPIITNNGLTPTRELIIAAAEAHFPDWIRNFPALLENNATEPYDPEIFFTQQWGGFRPQTGTLGPKQTYRFRGFWAPNSMIVRKASEPTWYHLFMLGAIHYRDIFEAPDEPNRITKYCFEIGIDATILTHITPLYFQCSNWNCTDNECENQKASDGPARPK